MGEVIFAIGDARIFDSAGSHAAVKGGRIEVGQTLSTGATGQIQIRFVDNAFVSVRPGSTLHIDTYTYNPENPATSFVKFTLSTGTVRSITGAAGKAAKDHFRLNTPVAAIGVRGTDFVVQTTADVTRVSVYEGAISMAPLTGGCRADGFGPCQTNLARQLTSATTNAYLELRSRTAAPELRPSDLNAPNRTNPPGPNEPHPIAPDKAGRMDSSSSEAVNTIVASEVQQSTPQTGVVQPPAAPAPVAPPPPPAQIWWGRWANYAAPDSAGSVSAVSTPNREIAVSNPVFGLYVDKNSMSALPTSGVVGFKLADYEAYRQEGATLLPASITDPVLTMDFGKKTFDTSLVWSQGGQNVPINATGKITWQGFMISDALHSNADVVGAIVGSGSQAGYLFFKPLDSTATAVGATRWVH